MMMFYILNIYFSSSDSSTSFLFPALFDFLFLLFPSEVDFAYFVMPPASSKKSGRDPKSTSIFLAMY